MDNQSNCCVACKGKPSGSAYISCWNPNCKCHTPTEHIEMGFPVLEATKPEESREWEERYRELFDQAVNFFEQKADVHSETNFVTLLNTLEMFKPFIKNLLLSKETEVYRQLKREMLGLTYYWQREHQDRTLVNLEDVLNLFK